MPYIITAVTPSGWRTPDTFDGVTRTTRRAVATLDEARAIVAQAYEDAHGHRHPADLAYAYERIGSGGTIGPLPDGTVIEVKRVCWNWIIAVADDLGIDTDAIYADGGDPAIIDAYNAAQAS